MTIVSGNTVDGAGGVDQCAGGGPINDSGGPNLSTTPAACGFTLYHELTADPLLGPLQDNGGPTDTMEPALGSPALDQWPYCPAVDQRGFARAGRGFSCDMGAVEVEQSAPPPPPPPPPPGTSAGGGAPVGPSKPARISAAKAFSLPSAHSCVSRRRLTIRIRKLPGIKWVSAKVTVNGKRVRTIKRSRITAPVDLRGLPKGRFKVNITATTSDGRTVTGARTYHTCTRKRPSEGPPL